MLVRITKFFRRKSYRWFRLTDTEFLLYSKKTSTKPLSTLPLSVVSFSQASPILKGFTNCIKLLLPGLPVFWLHFKNENEQFFFTSLLPNTGNPTANPLILVHNHTFNPQEFAEHIQQGLQVEENLKAEESKSKDSLEQLSQRRTKNFFLQEENLGSDTGQEGNLLGEQLKTYQKSYTKTKQHMVESSAQEHCLHIKNFSTSISVSEHDSDKEEGVLKFPDTKEKRKLGKIVHTSATTNFPGTPEQSRQNTKEAGSRNSLKKISFSAVDKSPQQHDRLLITSTLENEVSKRGHLFSFPASVLEGEVEKDIFEETLGICETRKMEFHEKDKKKKDLKKEKKSEKIPLRACKSYVPYEESLKRLYSDKALTTSRMGMSRRTEKVIGPRVLMTVIGPALKDESDEEQEQVENLSSLLDEIKVKNSVKEVELSPEKEEKEEKKGIVRLLSKKYRLSHTKELDDKSNLSISLLDDRNTVEGQLKRIGNVEECIVLGHRFMWNFELQDARKCFKLYKRKSLLVEFMAVECGLMEIAVSGAAMKIKKMLEVLQVLSNKANNMNYSQKDAPEEYFCNELHKAEICVFRAAMHFFLANKFQLIRALAEGWRYYRRLEQLFQKKQFRDCLSETSVHRFNFGYGCFNLVFSLIPQGLLKFMKFIGIVDANKEKGLEALERCRKEDNIRSNYSAIILALYRIEFEVSLERASAIMRDSLESYSKCPLFHWVASIVSWKYAQTKDAYFLIKTALWHLKANSQEATYLVYELGWYHFINMEFEKSLAIFKKIICHALPQQFFKNQVSDTNALVKSLKLPLAINFYQFAENFTPVSEEQLCIFPHLPHIAVKIAACYFNLGHYELAIKWLLSTQVIYKNYSHFKTKQEEDFLKFSLKFLSRCSMKMLAFEVIYLMKYMPKMPDENLLAILSQVEEYQASLSIDQVQLGVYLTTDCKEDPFIVEYFSSTLIRIVCYCLMGDTDIVCTIYKKILPHLCLVSEEFAYLVYHIEYWVGRAMISEDKIEEAKTILRALLKRKKCEFSINTRIRNVLAEVQ